jgi:hypothetical protein
VESAPDQGSTFFFIIPRQLPQTLEARPGEARVSTQSHEGGGQAA